jgi:cytochrome c oxidase assembly factor CtaG
MIAHVLLAGVAAPLLVLAEPVPPLLWSLPRRARSAVGQALSRMASWNIHVILSRPMPAAALHAIAVWAWHVPVLYDLAVRNEAAHWLQHVSFIVTALFLWSAVLRDRHFTGTGIVVLLVTLIHTGLLGALLTFSPAVLYHSHEPELWGLTDLEDQQLAGLIMWVPASFIYLAAALALAASLLQEPAPPRSGRSP